MTHHFHPKVYQKLLNRPEAYMGGEKDQIAFSMFDIKFLVFIYF